MTEPICPGCAHEVGHSLDCRYRPAPEGLYYSERLLWEEHTDAGVREMLNRLERHRRSEREAVELGAAMALSWNDERRRANGFMSSYRTAREDAADLAELLFEAVNQDFGTPGWRERVRSAITSPLERLRSESLDHVLAGKEPGDA